MKFKRMIIELHLKYCSKNDRNNLINDHRFNAVIFLFVCK
ncbi:hypothetical protein P343_03545 [Sporolactobacillus laevolacticus DSM 442]|uniref:Uncharacterized protein n=1 Tax=Sporolactobacillus laevolacticus DSM 442 TaxID=1395513 RepID=V6J090_9BACL|nr:hypothetical protein P343_03545 [Sporolactobacillus laevolacticus DSM 442]